MPTLWSKMLAGAVIGGSLLASPAAYAVPFVGTFTVDAVASDPALVIQTLPIVGGTAGNNNLSFDLDLYEHTYFNLLRIWTDETAVNPDDEVAHPITVTFSFTAPPPPFVGGVGGHTVGGIALFVFQGGGVTWNDPVVINFGPNHDGELSVYLEDETFNVGFLGLHEGKKHGADVKAKFKLLKDATPAQVPEPGGLALLGSGLLAALGVGLRRRRRH